MFFIVKLHSSYQYWDGSVLNFGFIIRHRDSLSMLSCHVFVILSTVIFQYFCNTITRSMFSLCLISGALIK